MERAAETAQERLPHLKERMQKQVRRVALAIHRLLCIFPLAVFAAARKMLLSTSLARDSSTGVPKTVDYGLSYFDRLQILKCLG